MRGIRNFFIKIRTKIKKVEWSKKFSALIALGFGAYGIWCGIKYYELCRAAIDNFSILPDPTLAVACVTTVIASLVSYLLYQAGLKNSRNKYGIDEDGQPFKLKELDIEEEVDDLSLQDTENKKENNSEIAKG